MLPDKINLGPLTYSLHVVPGEQFPADAGDGNDYFGLTVHADQAVYIHSANSDQLSKMIVMHEALHVMFFQTGVSADSEAEEHLVRDLAPLFVTFIRENPELVAYIGSKDA